MFGLSPGASIVLGGLLVVALGTVGWLVQRQRLRKRLNASADEPTQTEEIGASPDPEGVEALLEIAQGAVDDERERGRALDSKAASLTAFAGAVLSINAVLGRPLLGAKLGELGDVVVRTCFIVAAVGLLIAVLSALVAVSRPQTYRGLGRKQLSRFADAETQRMPKLEVHQAMLGSLSDIINTDRPVNDRKATALKVAAGFIALGLTGVAGEALTLGIREIGL